LFLFLLGCGVVFRRILEGGEGSMIVVVVVIVLLEQEDRMLVVVGCRQGFVVGLEGDRGRKMFLVVEEVGNMVLKHMRDRA
jgi:hypothetical protein